MKEDRIGLKGAAGWGPADVSFVSDRLGGLLLTVRGTPALA